jgi:hypothetical protein
MRDKDGVTAIAVTSTPVDPRTSVVSTSSSSSPMSTAPS